MLYWRYCHVSTFFFVNPAMSQRFHEICLSEIFQWVWLKLLSSFLLQAKRISSDLDRDIMLGVSCGGRVCLLRNEETGVFPLSPGLEVFFLCCPQPHSPIQSSLLPLSLQVIWPSVMPLWGGLRNGKLCPSSCPCSPHLQEFRYLGLTRKTWAGKLALLLKHLLMLLISFWFWLDCLSYLPT